jgi:hypothetical protein
MFNDDYICELEIIPLVRYSDFMRMLGETITWNQQKWSLWIKLPYNEPVESKYSFWFV